MGLAGFAFRDSSVTEAPPNLLRHPLQQLVARPPRRLPLKL